MSPSAIVTYAADVVNVCTSSISSSKASRAERSRGQRRICLSDLVECLCLSFSELVKQFRAQTSIIQTVSEKKARTNYPREQAAPRASAPGAGTSTAQKYYPARASGRALHSSANRELGRTV